MFRFACGDVMPGCSALFESSDRDELLTAVARHAAASHGIDEITPDVLDAVTRKIAFG